MSQAERIRELLSSHGVRPNRALGQNFLLDAETLAAIAGAAEPQGKRILEIGPGTGALTRRLLERGPALVEAVEKDAVMADILRGELPDERLRVVNGDFLRYAPEAGFSPFTAAGNLPYYITTPISERLICFMPQRAVLMVQKEAAARFFAQPGEAAYGPLAALSQAYYRPERLMDVPRTSFWPQPEVDSAVVRLTLREGGPQTAPQKLLAFCNRAFAMRRKTLYNNLKDLPALPAALEELGLSGSVRAEALPPETLLALCRRTEP